MKKITALLHVLICLFLCSGCNRITQHPKESETPEPTPTVDPEVVEATRINKLLHSDEINHLTEQISKESSGELFVKRADAYYEIADKENNLEAFHLAEKDYVMAYYFGVEADKLSEKMTACYKAFSEEEEQNGNLEDAIGLLERMNVLTPSSDTLKKLKELRAKYYADKANTEERESITDEQGEEVGYYITKFDEAGLPSEKTTYDLEDNEIDKYTDYEFDENYNMTKSGIFDADYKFSEYQIVEFDEYGNFKSNTIYSMRDDKELGTVTFDYDVLGRNVGYTITDSHSGKVHGSAVYLYNNDGYCYAMDEYDSDGYLIGHTVFDDEGN